MKKGLIIYVSKNEIIEKVEFSLFVLEKDLFVERCIKM